jgi:hypothetical protein
MRTLLACLCIASLPGCAVTEQPTAASPRVILRTVMKEQPAPPLAACAQKRICPAMVSCAEAVHYFVHCHVQGLDGNHNGIPCEDLCVRDRVKGTLEEKKREMCSLINRAPYFTFEGRLSRGVPPLDCDQHQL